MLPTSPSADTGLPTEAAVVLLHPCSRSWSAVTVAVLRAIARGRRPLPPETAADLVRRARVAIGLEVRP
jgi:hypothetical protein